MWKSLLGFLAVVSVTMACTCSPTPVPEVAFAEAKAVFLGRVVRMEIVRDESGSGFERLECAFECVEVFKGTSFMASSGAHRVATVQTGRGGGDCGVEFALDQLYLVYAYGDAHLATDICTRTRPFRAVEAEELETLRQLREKK
jgi:hypothetical protein